MGLFGLFKGKQTADKALDIVGGMTKGIINGADALFFTEEEKNKSLTERIKIFHEMSKTNIEFAKTTHSESTIRSKTRRTMSYVLIGNTIVTFWSIAIAWFFSPAWATFMIKLCGAFWIGGAFMSVVIFYYGNHVASGLIRQVKSK